jgi:hypothetical protein
MNGRAYSARVEGAKYGVSFGSALAIAISYTTNHSILGRFVHGCTSSNFTLFSSPTASSASQCRIYEVRPPIARAILVVTTESYHAAVSILIAGSGSSAVVHRYSENRPVEVGTGHSATTAPPAETRR